MAIFYHELDIVAPIQHKRLLSQFILQYVKNYGGKKKAHIDYIFCTDAYLLELNQQFLDHDTFTDIITFDLSDNEQELKSEIYISVERVVENAQKFGVTTEHELLRVIFHGMLHLCGYKDKTEEEEALMRTKENETLEAYQQFLTTCKQK